MDIARAHGWFAELVGKQVGGWTVEELIGSGKSAIVVRATRNGEAGALKLFEKELVERYGKDVQLARVERERSLIGEDHPALVRILDGGRDGDLLYVVMELLTHPWQQLSKRIVDAPRDKIANVISILATGAMRLEQLGLAHRDIKPENVMVTSDFARAKLLDFGVLRPIGGSDITDHGGVTAPFIGTLRYSPPEFLMRMEQDSIEGWRAVTIYQLGGILHDLIMRKPLFEEYSEPFTLLSDAVRTTIPEIDAPDVPRDLVVLCKNALIKSASLRLKCVEWENFGNVAAEVVDTGELRRERVAKRYLASSEYKSDGASADRASREWVRAMHLALDSVLAAIRSVVTAHEFPVFQLINEKVCPRNPCVVSLRLMRSPAHSLAKDLAITYTVELIDANEKVCQIAATLPAEWSSVSSLSKWGHPPYFGVADQEAIRLFVRDGLYELMDVIQSGTHEKNS